MKSKTKRSITKALFTFAVFCSTMSSHKDVVRQVFKKLLATKDINCTGMEIVAVRGGETIRDCPHAEHMLTNGEDLEWTPLMVTKVTSRSRKAMSCLPRSKK